LFVASPLAEADATLFAAGPSRGRAVKIALTGASGGIGRSLMTTLGAAHEMIGIVRRPPAAASGQRFVNSGDRAALHAALAEADCVIHCALDAKAKGAQFLVANRTMNTEILAGALAGKCRLYVFVSSQVVYAGTDPADPGGYREDQSLVLTPRLDDYTRLKIESEREVVDACTKAGVDYLIVRPTVVMGPGMAWSEGVVGASRWITIGIRSRTMNVVHVDDLSRQMLLLLERGAHNDIFNLGTMNVTTDAYFGAVGAITGHRPLFVPKWLMGLVGKLLPSTLWFFARNVAINSDRVAAATGFASGRDLAGHFARRPLRATPDTLEALRQLQLSGRAFRVHGRGYHLWFNAPHGDDRIAMAGYAGIVALEGDRLRVKAGTRLSEICDYLEGVGLALPTLPEFLGISAGACFFVDVHGSSRDHFSLYEFIDEIRYLDDTGTEIVSPRDEAQWAALRHRTERFIVTEITFRCVPSGWLSNRMGWEDEARLEHYLAGGFREHMATTIQWYPHYRQLLVYKIDEVAGPQPGAAPSVAPFRGLPYLVQRLFLALRLRGRPLQIDKAYRILAPWRHLPLEPFLEWLYWQRRLTWRDMEMCLTLEDGRAFMAELRAMMGRGEIAVRKRASVGFRFSHDRTTGRDYVWIEFVSDAPELVESIVAMARRTATDGVRFHRGKYVPRG
jgi:nucleoside-diphosphate-sugar epimerase